jgi:hypothetical protein
MPQRLTVKGGVLGDVLERSGPKGQKITGVPLIVRAASLPCPRGSGVVIRSRAQRVDLAVDPGEGSREALGQRHGKVAKHSLRAPSTRNVRPQSSG